MRLLKIGRDPSCDIALQSPRVSAIHAEITLLNNGDILLEDKDSKYGTFIMNRPIKPGVQVNVKRGDAIRFADVELLWDQVPPLEDNTKYKAVFGIGSNFRNEIQISGNTVSRFHATLKVDKKGHAVIQDHSKNGTMVNGQRLNYGQIVSVTKKDSIVCGGVPVNISQYIPNSLSVYKTLGLVASVLIIIGCGYGFWHWIDGYGKVSLKESIALENASVCVYGGYYYTVTIKDDPFRNVLRDWPAKWFLGMDEQGKLLINSSTDGMLPIRYTGTAFFISKDGEMGTNRHIAVPWEYRTPREEENIRQLMEMVRQADSGKLYRILRSNVKEGRLSVDNANAWLRRYQNSDFEIGGMHSYFGIGLSGYKINNIIDLQQCQLIAESEDVKKDVALIRLNSRKTPDYIVKMGAIYDIENARVDERSLKPQDENFIIVGYPLGEHVANETFDGKELRPTIHRATLSKTPDDNQIQIQVVGIGGQSGSPVIDSKHRLVGVLCSGFSGTEVTYCCNIKHLKALYDKNKVRE
jgi:pSer/pThr/pTyr-binding forkhead associated (FHA) protein